MGNRYQSLTKPRGDRMWVAIAIYAGCGWVALRLLSAARAESNLPAVLDTGFLWIYLSGFLVTVLLIRTGIAGGGPPILHALRALAVALVIAAMGLLVAHWIEIGGATAHAQAASRQAGYQADATLVAESCREELHPEVGDCQAPATPSER